MALGEIIEERGDSAVEEIKTDADSMHQWNGDLDNPWAAADGGMESNIGLLWSLYYLQEYMDKPKVHSAELKKMIYDAIKFQDEAADAMMGTGYFSANAGLDWDNMAFEQAYRKYPKMKWVNLPCNLIHL